MADLITRLIAENFEHYIVEATRSTTAGQNKDDQNFTWKPTQHVGILMPYKDFAWTGNNEELIKKVEAAAPIIHRNGGIDFAAVIKMQQVATDLLYWNDWSEEHPEDEEYV